MSSDILLHFYELRHWQYSFLWAETLAISICMSSDIGNFHFYELRHCQPPFLWALTLLSIFMSSIIALLFMSSNITFHFYELRHYPPFLWALTLHNIFVSSNIAFHFYELWNNQPFVCMSSDIANLHFYGFWHCSPFLSNPSACQKKLSSQLAIYTADFYDLQEQSQRIFYPFIFTLL